MVQHRSSSLDNSSLHDQRAGIGFSHFIRIRGEYIGCNTFYVKKHNCIVNVSLKKRFTYI